MREDFIHYWIRKYFVLKGWRLLAGQYPNGSDDLPPLNVVDPEMARDQSPDPRRHSEHKKVPDLVVEKERRVIILEVKPGYDQADVAKLRCLIEKRRDDLVLALRRLNRICGYGLEPVDSLIFEPAIAFSEDQDPVMVPDGFHVFVMSDDGEVTSHFVG